MVEQEECGRLGLRVGKEGKTVKIMTFLAVLWSWIVLWKRMVTATTPITLLPLPVCSFLHSRLQPMSLRRRMSRPLVLAMIRRSPWSLLEKLLPRTLFTGSKGSLTLQVRCEFIVSSETICLGNPGLPGILPCPNAHPTCIWDQGQCVQRIQRAFVFLFYLQSPTS